MSAMNEDWYPQVPKGFWTDDEIAAWCASYNARMEFLNNRHARFDLGHPQWDLALDGVTDDTEAAQAVIDRVESEYGGGRLYLPHSTTMRITAPLVIPRSLVVDICGHGRFSVIQNDGSDYAIKMDDDAVNVSSFFDFSNFRIQCAAGASGINLNNSRSVSAMTGTVTLTNGSNEVIGSGTNFSGELDVDRDAVEIDGIEYELRFAGGNPFNATEMELAARFTGVTASGLSINRVRYGSGTRWGKVHDIWIQCDDPTAGTFGFKGDRMNNVTFRNLQIRGFDTGFHCSASTNGRSAGCWMDTVICSNSISKGYYFFDSRAFAMKRCRSEGNPDYAYYFDTCHAFIFDYCSAEDDHTEAGWYFDTCERMQGVIGTGTNFGGGIGIHLVNSDSNSFQYGQVAAQVLRETILSRGSTDTAVASIAFDYWINGVEYTKAAITTGTALPAQTVPADTWAIYRLTIDTAGTITVTAGADNATTGYASKELALAALPAAPSGSIGMGYLRVKTKAGTAWIAGTDALAGGTSGNPASETEYAQTDLVRPGILIDSASQSNEFYRISVEQALYGAIVNNNTTSTINYLDWDNQRPGIIASRIPTRQYQKTVTAGSTSLSQFDAAVVLIDASGGAVTLALPNVVATNTTTGVASTLGLRFTFYALDATNTITIQRAGSDVIDDVTSAGNANQFTMADGECVMLEATEAGHWKFIARWNKPSASIGALTDSTGGTANNTLDAVSGSGADTTINNNFADLAAKVNALAAALRASRLID